MLCKESGCSGLAAFESSLAGIDCFIKGLLPTCEDTACFPVVLLKDPFCCLGLLGVLVEEVVTDLDLAWDTETTFPFGRGLCAGCNASCWLILQLSDLLLSGPLSVTPIVFWTCSADP